MRRTPTRPRRTTSPASRSPSPTSCRHSPAGAVGFFGYDLVRTVEPLAEPNPDPIGLPDMALMITDLLVAFDHQRHEVTLIANAFVEDGGIEEAYARAVDAIGDLRERLREPVPAAEVSTQPDQTSASSPT